MLIEELEKIESKCITVDETVNYWLIRTQGGSLYKPFLEHGIISIGYNEIKTSDILNSDYGEHKDRSSYLKAITEAAFPTHKRPGIISSQIERFFFEMKKGDHVLIPGHSSSEFSIGIIDDDQGFYLKKDMDSEVEHSVIDSGYSKARKVKWKKKIEKSLVNPNLYKLFFSHHTVVNAKDYTEHINSMLYDFYKYGDSYHLVFDIKQQKVSAMNLFNGYNDAFLLAQKFVNSLGDSETLDDIELSINLNSPGKVDFIKKSAKILIITGLIIVGLSGGGLEFVSDKFTFGLTTDGLIQSLSDFLSDAENREMQRVLVDKIQSLNISDPDDIINMVNAAKKE